MRKQSVFQEFFDGFETLVENFISPGFLNRKSLDNFLLAQPLISEPDDTSFAAREVLYVFFIRSARCFVSKNTVRLSSTP